MKIIPFRTKVSEEEANYCDVYEFLIQGSNKKPYTIEIEIDNFNDTGLQACKCTCPDHQFRSNQCKHIKECLDILEDHEIKLEVKV